MPDINDTSTTGVLQSLMKQYQDRMNLGEYQRQVQGRNALIDEYEQGVRNAPPGMSQFQMGVSNWLGAGGTGPNDIVRGVGNAQSQFAKQQLSQHEARQQGLLDTTKMRDLIAKEEDAVLKSQIGLVSKAGLGASKPIVKMDKNGDMVEYNPATGESRVVHSSQRGEYQRVWMTAYGKAVDEGMPDPENYAHSIAMNVLGRSKDAVPGAAVPGAAVPGAAVPGAAVPGAAVPGAADTSIKYKNKPEEARKTELLSGDEKAARKDYEENIAPQATAAESMLNTLSAIKQIPRTQDMFAPYREKVGAAVNAIGLDGSMVREAQNLQQLRPLLSKIANDRLLLAKGTQTEGDAQRAYNEFMRITDTQQAVDFMYAWTQELANRAKFKSNLYNKAREAEGTWTKGKQYWDNSDYARAVPVAITKQGPKSYTDFRDQFVKLNKAGIDSGEIGVDDILEAWNGLAKRGGK